MSLLARFTAYIADKNLFRKKDRLIIAVSGGVDSVCLCELCKQAGFDFEIAHCNFQLRGEESDRDEDFVRQIAVRYNVPAHVKKIDTEHYAKEKSVSVQVAARELRYQWFDELVNSAKERQQKKGDNHLVYLLTAHHADDNVETILINFFKGTGIKGLRGMLPRQNYIVRPLLFARRQAIEAFVKENKLSFVEDSSNLTDKYTRNYFRHRIIPGIQKVFPRAESNLLDNISRFADIELLYKQAIDLHKKKLLAFHENEVHIPVLKLLKTEPLATVVFEIIKDYGFSPAQTGGIIQLLHGESGKYVASSTHKIIRSRNWLIISPTQTTEANTILIEESDKSIDFEAGILELKHFSNNGAPVDSSGAVAMLDSANITFPLFLRKWKRGDYFYPLGMQKKKKLSRFFIDQKLSLAEKENIWVIESNKKILWIINYRIDDRFKITPGTKNILQFKMRAR
ncbi:MAG TPA: tRNA lysidine(34) synthetase TilS [Chitinophagaceae bacterium]|nr:tRNA lysidine(34) synthetase TilS [Chitinophagaceae bacterium]